MSQVHLPSQKLLILAGGGVVGIFLLWYVILAVSFSAQTLRDHTLAALSSHLGAEVTALPGEKFTLLPTPRLQLSSLQIKNNPKSRYPSLLSAPVAVIQPSLASIFGDLIVSVSLNRPKIELESFKDGSHSWDLPKTEPVSAPRALIQSLDFFNGSLHYNHPKLEESIQLDQFSFGMHFQAAGQAQITGQFHYLRDYFQINASSNKTGDRYLELKNSSSRYALSGKWDESRESFTGQQHFETSDLGQLLSVFMLKGQDIPQIASGKGAYPLKVGTEINLKDSRMTLTEIEVDGEYLQGDGQAVLLMKHIPEMNIQLLFDQFTIDPLVNRNIFRDFVSQTSKQSPEEFTLEQGRKSSLPSTINATLAISSKEAQVGALPIEKMQLAAQLSQGTLNVAQWSGLLGDTGQFLLKGKVEGSYDGLAFKGSGDVAGQDLSTMIATLNHKESSSFLPQELKRFRGRANLYITPQITRISETAFRAENVQVIGTLLRKRMEQDAKGNTAYRYEGAFRTTNFNIDNMQSLYFPKSDEQKPIEKALLEWFEYVKSMNEGAGQSIYNLKLSFADPIFHGKKREAMDVRLRLNSSELSLEELNIPYNGTTLRGEMKFSFTKEKKPIITASLSADQVDTSRFMGVDFTKQASMWRDKEGLWSREEFQVQGLEKVQTDIRFETGKFRHAEYRFDDLKGRIIIDEGALRIEDLEGGIWGARFLSNVKMVIGKLPVFSGVLTLQGFDFARLHPVTNLFSNLYGRGTFNVKFNTSGLNPYTAVENLQGTASFAGANLKVVGFNLANMVRAANAVRKVQDIDKLIKFANRGGETQISKIQGNMNFADGLMRTPQMQISTPFGSGIIRGQINLLDWKANLGISIFLTALSKQQPPDIRMLFIGPLSEVKRSLDTQSLESFIAKQAAERLLVNP
jgi:uncharacterized protein involved in outer membrane biogenesis